MLCKQIVFKSKQIIVFVLTEEVTIGVAVQSGHILSFECDQCINQVKVATVSVLELVLYFNFAVKTWNQPITVPLVIISA